MLFRSVTINAINPGAVKTEPGRENGRLYRWWKKTFHDPGLRTVEISAEALYYCGVSTDLDGVSGRYFSLTTEENPAPPARDRDVALALWERTLVMSGLTSSPDHSFHRETTGVT